MALFVCVFRDLAYIVLISFYLFFFSILSGGSRFGNWSNSSGSRNVQFRWQVKESTSTVTTRSGLTTGDPFPFGSESDEDWNSSGREDPKSSSETEEEAVGDMANLVDGEPAHAIVSNQR